LVRAVAPGVRIVAAQSVNTAAMAKSIAAGRITEIESLPTLADGLAGKIDAEAFDIGRNALDEIVTLSEAEIARTIAWLWRDQGQRVEGAGACAAGAVWLGKTTIKTPAAIVISGGNIDQAKLDAVLAAS
jgi:threonine dehydratase